MTTKRHKAATPMLSNIVYWTPALSLYQYNIAHFTVIRWTDLMAFKAQ